MSEDTKVCPYCAETIKVAAVVCRFCGRDLLVVEETQPEKESVPKKTKKPMNGFVKMLLLFVGGLIAACLLIRVLIALTPDDSGAPPTYTPHSPAVLTPTPAPKQVSAPPLSEMVENYNEMTDAQWEMYANTIEGAYIDKWEGVVRDVDAGEILGGYDIYIDMDEGSSPNIYIGDVSEEMALSINKDQKVVVSGIIGLASNSFGLTLHLDAETVTIEPFQGERTDRQD